MEYFYQYLIDAVKDLESELGNFYEFVRAPWGTDIFVFVAGDIAKYDDPTLRCVIRNEGDPREWFIIRKVPDEYRGEVAEVLASGTSAVSALREYYCNLPRV